MALGGVGSAQELLKDGDLEASRPDGTFPSSGFWQAAWLGQAGSICVDTGRTGNGLMLYTGAPTNDFWAAPFQDSTTGPGQAFRGSAWIGTPPGQPWIEGTRARVHVAFLNASTNVLTSFESPAVTQPSTPWQVFEVVSEVAPPGTALVRFMCLLEKPKGVEGLSVAMFDDCSLRATPAVGVEVSSRAVGIPADVSQASFTIRNTGNVPLSWHIEGNPSWLTVRTLPGTLWVGATEAVSFNVDRSGLGSTGCVKGSVDLVSDAGTLPIRIYLDMPSAPPPLAPALVHTSGSRLEVRDRLPDGSLAPPFDYVIRGTGWSPSSRDTPDIFAVRRLEFAKWYVVDIQMLREMNANTVYTFLDFGTDPAGRRVLDHLYKNGLKAIVTVDENGTGNTNNLVEVVTAYRDHPALLAWSIGNEWNINSYHDLFPRTYAGYLAAAALTETMAGMIKALDPNHPVVSTHGDIYPPEMGTLVNQLCPSVDIWGLNVYRGPGFTTLFQDWATITTKPMFFSEFGTDAYRTLMVSTNQDQALISVDGAVDEVTQARWNRRLWHEAARNLSAFDPSRVCLGGTVFEWNDEWWKGQGAFGAEVGRHDNLGFYTSWNPESHPDSVANEEWFGQVSVDRNPRLSYAYFQEDFAPGPDPGLQLTASWSPVTGAVTLRWVAVPGKEYEVHHAGDLSGALWAVLPGNLSINGSDAQFVDPAPGTSGQRFYRVLARPGVVP